MELMTVEEQLEEQTKALRTLSAGLFALVDELHESGLVDRDAVADRLERFREPDGSPKMIVLALAAQIRSGHFASATTRDFMSVVDGGNAED